MVSFMYRLLWLSCGIVSPVYSSYKTIKDKNVKEYVRLMMFWVVFAIFSFVEVFTDFFLSWLPFYFEVKVVVLLWLVLPATRGSTVVYMRYIHPMLISREKEIDSYVKSLKDHCFDFLVFLGSKGLGMFTDLIVTVTIKGQAKLASHLRSLSLSDLSGVDTNALQRSESLQGSNIKSSTKRARLLRFNTISGPTNRSEMDIIVRSESRFHDNVNSSRTSILEEEDLTSNSEHESASEALKLPNKEPTDLIAGSEFNLITQCPSSLAVDKASSFLQNDLTLNCAGIPKSEKAVCSTVNDESSDVIPRTSIEISSSLSPPPDKDTGVHRSPTQTTPLPSRNEASSSTLNECSQIVKVELTEQHSSDILNQSSFKANPSSCPEPSLLKKSIYISRPSTKSSGFTKNNFLRSFKFFDAKGSKSIKTLDSNPRPK